MSSTILTSHEDPKRDLPLIHSAWAKVKRHPVTIPLVTGLGAAGLFYAAPLGLGVIGFGTAGPIAGSLAAIWQASLGVVQAGSLFATLQSAAMGGTILGTLSGATLAGTASSLTVGMLWGKGPNGRLAPNDGLMEDFQKAFVKQRKDHEAKL